jgi:hypothetical protein
MSRVPYDRLAPFRILSTKDLHRGRVTGGAPVGGVIPARPG